MTQTFAQFIDSFTAPRMPRARIELGWEVLPNSRGEAHLVDPDPDVQFESFPVSLCRTFLIVKDGVITDLDVCPICTELSRERQAEFDAEVGQ